MLRGILSIRVTPVLSLTIFRDIMLRTLSHYNAGITFCSSWINSTRPAAYTDLIVIRKRYNNVSALQINQIGFNPAAPGRVRGCWRWRKPANVCCVRECVDYTRVVAGKLIVHPWLRIVIILWPSYVMRRRTVLYRYGIYICGWRDSRFAYMYVAGDFEIIAHLRRR